MQWLARRAAEDLQAKWGTRAVGIKCDVSQKASVDNLILNTVEQLGGLDILVANAGIVKTAPFLDMAEDDFDAVIGVNLKGTFLVSSLYCSVAESVL